MLELVEQEWERTVYWLNARWYRWAIFLAAMGSLVVVGTMYDVHLRHRSLDRGDWIFFAVYGVALVGMYFYGRYLVGSQVIMRNMTGDIAYNKQTHELTLTVVVPEANRDAMMKSLLQPGARYSLSGVIGEHLDP